MVRTFTLGLVAVFPLLALGCSDKDEAGLTPTAEAPTAPAASTPTAAPSPTATVSGVLAVPSRALLLDVASGKVTTLHESLADAAWSARIDGNVVELSVAGGVRRFNLDGTTAPPAPGNRSCAAAGGGVEIDGRRFPGVTKCGSISPDGRWMAYEVDAGEVTGPSGAKLPSWDQWVLEIATGSTRELQKGLVHCGGCDARYGPRWSPTSEYVAYAEYGGPRRFLSDVTTGETRVIGGGNDIGFAPEWAPSGNRIVYASGQTRPATARFEDLDRGLAVDLPIPWPVGFDSSGLYLYSPAWGEGSKETGKSTTVISASTLATVAMLSGTPAAWLPWRPGDSPIVVGERGVVAALQRAAGCDGTSITVGAAPAACIAGGASGAINPGGTTIAVARAVGLTGPAKGPGFETVSLTRYAIELFDVATGRVSTVMTDILSWDYQSPIIIWNAAGTHLLVVAPSVTGL